MWHKYTVTIFIERYILPILATLTLIVILSNPFHFGWWQRIVGGAIVVVVAFAVSRVAHRLNTRPQSAASSTIALPAAHAVGSPSTESIDGRILITVEPDYLMGFFREHTTIQAEALAAAFLRKWMKVTGKVKNVTPASTHSIMVSIDRPLTSNIVLFFDQEAWRDRLAVLRRDDPITVVGQFNGADEHHITLENCELTDK